MEEVSGIDLQRLCGSFPRASRQGKGWKRIRAGDLPEEMNLYANLPPEWQGETCPGNGRGCGARLYDQTVWSPVNSCYVITRSCMTHSKEAPLPVQANERPLRLGKWSRHIEREAKDCHECGKSFIPQTDTQNHCPELKCMYRRRLRCGYMGNLRKHGIELQAARRMAFEKYPRLGG